MSSFLVSKTSCSVTILVCWYGVFTVLRTSTSCQTSLLQSCPFLRLRTNFAANCSPVDFWVHCLTTAYCPLKNRNEKMSNFPFHYKIKISVFETSGKILISLSLTRRSNDKREWNWSCALRKTKALAFLPSYLLVDFVVVFYRFSYWSYSTHLWL